MARLDFKGKQLVWNHHLAVSYHELIPQKDKSLTDKLSLQDNLIIKGDNLLALKALLPTYAGKVKCIYIDPPYNTGNEGWAYNDNVNSPMIRDWLGKTVDRDDLTRHDKWLCMMTPRLKLLRDLLRDDGVILISINDEELALLLQLLSEIFGEENHVATFIWHNEGNIDNQSKIKINHEYVVAFAKNITELKTPVVIDPNVGSESKLYNEEIQNSITKNGPKNPPSKIRLPTGFPADFEKGIIPIRIDYPKSDSVAVIENGKLKNSLTLESGWSSKRLLELFIENHFSPIVDQGNKMTWFKLTKTGAIYQYKERSTEQHHVLSVLRNFGTTKQTSSELEQIGVQFDYPKPIRLIDYLIRVFTPEKDGIVLDSFAGSGTTGHSTLLANYLDSGKRHFILIELEAAVAINVTRPRIEAAIKGHNHIKGLNGSFSYFELGKAIEMQSILSGERLPSYVDLSRYVFYTATGEEFDESKVDESRHFIGSSTEYDVFLLYEPNVEKLKNLALTLDHAEAWGKPGPTDKKRLVFAPTKYLDQNLLDEYHIFFAQLPFEIYELSR